MADTSETQLIEELQRRLRTSGPMPKREIVVAALAMSRDPSILSANACDDAGVARGSRARATEFSRRITREGLIAACTPRPPSAPRAPSPSPTNPPLSPRSRQIKQLKQKYPNLRPPTCSECSEEFQIITIFVRGSCCYKCEASLPYEDRYWYTNCCCHGPEALCHSCTDAAAQLDNWWDDVKGGLMRGTPQFDRDWDELSVSNYSIDFPAVSETSEEVIEELKIARSLGLPCHVPYSAHGGARWVYGIGSIYDNYFSQLLVSKEWIAKNAPNIWWLSVGALVVSDDGKHATRELIARMKIYSEEDREKEMHDELDDFEDGNEETEVEYDFPSAESSAEIFAHERRIERMRQREMTAIRSLDIQAADDHRERKTQMERERRERQSMMHVGT